MEIRVENPHSWSPVALITTTKDGTGRETFSTFENALKTKEREVHNGDVAFRFRAVGVAGFLGALTSIGAGIAIGDSDKLILNVNSLSMGIAFIFLTKGDLDDRRLARRQIAEIRSAMARRASAGQRPR